MPALRRTGFVRLAILFAAIAAMLGVSLASTSASHIHLRPSGGPCDICVTAHVVSHEACAVIHLAGTIKVYEMLATGTTEAGYQLLLATPSLSRGPPLFFA